ncbi:MAG: DUF6077 domain-containing protein [Lachnospiraceae bacterium]|nr:DUF6077 domain-containing protein [Lachnospiraceae bacterium]
MFQYICCAGLILLYLCFYYMFGSLAAKRIPAISGSRPLKIIIGFFCYFFLFSVITIPLKVTLQPLSTLSRIWAGVLLLLTALSLFFFRKGRKQKLSSGREVFRGKQKTVFFLFLLLVLTQLIIVNLNRETYALWDQSYYIGDSATSLYTDTISQYDPYTGRILEKLDPEYLLETYQNHTAVMCQIFGLHPLVENRTVMASIVIILYNLIAWELGLVLFHGNRAKSLLMNGFLTLLNFFSFNLYTAAEFLLLRPSEGKTILAVLIIPSLLLFFLKTISEYLPRSWWACSFLVILGSFGLNMSAIYMIPFEISAFYLPLFIREKKLSIFRRLLILLLPCILMAAAYLLTKNRLFIYTSA